MKRGPLHFLGRKNQSLFDTNIKIKDMDNVELVLDSPAILESGTASVRARPTVKHHTSSYDSFQGFAVPTPKVPLLPPVNGPKANGLVGGDQLSIGSDLLEDDIIVPPHPSMAPPPPPGTFIPPPPDFMGDLRSLDPAALQPPSMPAPKPISLAPYMEEEDLTSLKPPPMAPPKPPSTGSNGSASSVPISSPLFAKVPDHPNFAPPQPPSERHYKTPPPKPIRLSSISNFDYPPQTPAPPPPEQTRTLTTFNPQNTPKVYNGPKTSVLSRPRLLLEDSASVKSSPVLVQVDDNAPTVDTPSKPVSKNAQELMEILQITQHSQPETKEETETETVSAPPINKPLQIPYQTSPTLPQVKSTWVNSELSKDKLEVAPSQSGRFSPLLDRKLRKLKSSETNAPGPAASPLALLMAAKEREKHRTTHSLSRENSAKKNDQPSSSIHPSDSGSNSFLVTPRSSSSSSLSQEQIQENPKSYSPVQTPETSSSPALVKDPVLSTYPAHNRMAPSASNLIAKKQNEEQSKEELSMPLLPPPPEFDDLDDIVGPPPSIPPPDPPMKKAPTPSVSLLPQAQAPAPPPKLKPPAAPQLPPPDMNVKPQVQTKSQVVPNQLPSNLSPSQVTLLSILQKKMLEMDHKMAPVTEAESSSDDWGAPLSDEESNVPVAPKATPQSKNYPVVNKATTLNMRELEGKVVKKYQETSSVKIPTSNGVQSKHQYGMTFTVRPGTKQPITLVSKENS